MCYSFLKEVFRISTLVVDPSTLIAFVLALAGGIGFGAIGFAISRIAAPSKPLPLKNERFDCGNQPTEYGRGQLTMQYYAYLVIFLTVEPVFIYWFLLLLDAHVAFAPTVELFSVILAMLISPIVFGLSAARKLGLWKMREETQT
jgi:NADH:ubiquinone oxidoreductase subunit 3 (subunit A)